jgi:hypothetical protein
MFNYRNIFYFLSQGYFMKIIKMLIYFIIFMIICLICLFFVWLTGGFYSRYSVWESYIISCAVGFIVSQIWWNHRIRK